MLSTQYQQQFDLPVLLHTDATPKMRSRNPHLLNLFLNSKKVNRNSAKTTTTTTTTHSNVTRSIAQSDLEFAPTTTNSSNNNTTTSNTSSTQISRSSSSLRGRVRKPSNPHASYLRALENPLLINESAFIGGQSKLMNRLNTSNQQTEQQIQPQQQQQQQQSYQALIHRRRRNGNSLLFMADEPVKFEMKVKTIRPQFREVRITSAHKQPLHYSHQQASSSLSQSQQLQSFEQDYSHSLLMERSQSHIENSCEMFYGDHEYISPRYNVSSRLRPISVLSTNESESISQNTQQSSSNSSSSSKSSNEILPRTQSVNASGNKRQQAPSEILKQELAAIHRKMRVRINSTSGAAVSSVVAAASTNATVSDAAQANPDVSGITVVVIPPISRSEYLNRYAVTTKRISNSQNSMSETCQIVDTLRAKAAAATNVHLTSHQQQQQQQVPRNTVTVLPQLERKRTFPKRSSAIEMSGNLLEKLPARKAQKQQEQSHLEPIDVYSSYLSERYSQQYQQEEILC